MATVPAPLARVIQELTKLPGIGEKTATRLAFHLSRTERRDVEAWRRRWRAARRSAHLFAVLCARRQ
jgi:recombination protein RecR